MSKNKGKNNIAYIYVIFFYNSFLYTVSFNRYKPLHLVIIEILPVLINNAAILERIARVPFAI